MMKTISLRVRRQAALFMTILGATTFTLPAASAADCTVASGAEQKKAQVYVAVYENNLVSAVRAGENKGKTLKHDYVVRSLAGPFALDDNGKFSRAQRFALDARWKPQDVHLAVFVQHPQSGDVLQAVTSHCR